MSKYSHKIWQKPPDRFQFDYIRSNLILPLYSITRQSQLLLSFWPRNVILKHGICYRKVRLSVCLSVCHTCQVHHHRWSHTVCDKKMSARESSFPAVYDLWQHSKRLLSNVAFQRQVPALNIENSTVHLSSSLVLFFTVAMRGACIVGVSTCMRRWGN